WTYPPLARPNGKRGVLRRSGIGALLTLRSDPWLGRVGALADDLARNRQGAVGRAKQTLWDLQLSRTAAWTDEAAVLALLTLVYAGESDTAAGWCERLMAEAGRRAVPTWQALLTAVRAETAVRQGDLVAAAEHAREALTVLPAKAWGVAVGLPLGSLILATTRMGAYDEAAGYLAGSVPNAMYESWFGLPYLHARGSHHLARNHAHAALADFLSCEDLQRAWGVDVPGPVPWRTSAAEAWLRLGNRDRAKQLAHEQLARPGTGNPRTRGLALRLYAAVSPPSRRLQLLTEALELLEHTGDRYEQARVLADLSRTHYALGEHRKARLLFRQSLHVAHACKATPLAQELLLGNSEAAGAGPQADSSAEVSELTESERRVASLAVMGYTNREIATRLYITPSTVEQHLTRVYRKLRIKRRQDLPADLWMNATRAG
ncbi:helix-turn-helix transcriptional regulator, partial [Streptomyces phytophilus]|uniref:helix-turn-helix transcriptional regulator n=1 Tax=Streptomyces phytophilus TaxID=722715 RepID=UPI0015F0D414